jgi:bifunctional non-homologous end joining protein LigD
MKTASRCFEPLSFVEPLIPTLTDTPPADDGWLHEVKHDGYRTLMTVESGHVRVYTRRGSDWTDRYREIAAQAAKLPCRSAIIDGEAVVLDKRGVSDFHALRSALGWGGREVILYAFDLLHLDGTDFRSRPIEERRRACENC